jgi:hypothetical protein
VEGYAAWSDETPFLKRRWGSFSPVTQSTEEPKEKEGGFYEGSAESDNGSIAPGFICGPNFHASQRQDFCLCFLRR